MGSQPMRAAGVLGFVVVAFALVGLWAPPARAGHACHRLHHGLGVARLSKQHAKVVHRTPSRGLRCGGGDCSSRGARSGGARSR